MSNVNKKITNFYCNGFFGRRYDLTDVVIEAEGKDWIVIRPAKEAVDGTEPTIATFVDESHKENCLKV